MERTTIIWSAITVVILAIAIWLGALAWLNNPINNAFGPEPSTYCEQDSDCGYAVTHCDMCEQRTIVNNAYSGALCPFPASKLLRCSVEEMQLPSSLKCVENVCTVVPNQINP
jgi:hypothetical protein